MATENTHRCLGDLDRPRVSPPKHVSFNPDRTDYSPDGKTYPKGCLLPPRPPLPTLVIAPRRFAEAYHPTPVNKTGKRSWSSVASLGAVQGTKENIQPIIQFDVSVKKKSKKPRSENKKKDDQQKLETAGSGSDSKSPTYKSSNEPGKGMQNIGSGNSTVEQPVGATHTWSQVVAMGKSNPTVVTPPGAPIPANAVEREHPLNTKPVLQPMRGKITKRRWRKVAAKELLRW